MPTPIQTTAGPVEDPSTLGRCLAHEHLLAVDEAIRFQWPHVIDRDDERRRALEAVRGVQSHGVETIVDPSCMYLGRDVRWNLEIAQETGIRFVMGTGIYGSHYSTVPTHMRSRGADYVASLFVHDLQHGIQGTDVKAHFLKCALDAPGVTDDMELVHRAIARASLQTGAPIIAHSNPNEKTGLESMRIFTEEGVDPAKVVIAHCGDTTDVAYLETLLETGCWIGLDRYGIDLYLAAEPRDDTTKTLLDRGYADRIHLSHDFVAFLDWFPVEMKDELAPDWSMTLLFEQGIPRLLEAGVEQATIDAILTENVWRWLAG